MPIAHRIAMLTEDRELTGLFLVLSVLENLVMAWGRGIFLKTRELARICGTDRGVEDQDPQQVPDRKEPQRRQPAEGVPFPLAADGAADHDPRRADQGGGRRGQGGNPPDHVEPGRPGKMDNHDLLGCPRSWR